MGNVVGAAALVAFAVYIAVLLWYQQAATAWQRRVDPALAENPGRQIRRAAATLGLMGAASDDPEIDRLRLRAYRRWRIMVALVPTIFLDPLIAGIAAVSLVRATQIGVIATAVVGFEVALLAASIVRLAVRTLDFGNGLGVRARTIWTLLGQVTLLAALLAAQTVVLTP